MHPPGSYHPVGKSGVYDYLLNFTLIIHLDFYILLPLSYHFCLTNNPNILNPCRTAECSQPRLSMWSVSLVDLTRWLPAPLGGSGLLDRHVSSNMKEHGSQPSFLGWQRAEGPRLQHDTPRHSRVSGLRSSGAPPESGHFSSRVCSRFLLQTGAFCAATTANEHWPALSPLSSSLYGLQWWSFHCLPQGEEYDQRRALFNIVVSSLFNIVNLTCPLTINHLNVKFVGGKFEEWRLICNANH